MRCLGMADLRLSMVTVTFPGSLGQSTRCHFLRSRFFVRSMHRFSVPTWVQGGAARSRGQDWPERSDGHRRRRARSGLDGGEHVGLQPTGLTRGARLGRVGGSAIAPLVWVMIRGEPAIGTIDRATNLYSVDPAGSGP
jgi:hypothetical protein